MCRAKSFIELEVAKIPNAIQIDILRNHEECQLKAGDLQCHDNLGVR